ncbi:hypothetical protein [Nonomuraea soli]|uniref:Uncharacterized protein n=1 Tax=Nonomuraea soli TaxID=1032476 RepID=A0A7W0HVK9_9ACTN|nr:hypothetical protein [Nonomuraea soli]MBA2897354.1 hypothetical protein [Nonomuraea soli]
MSLGRAVLVGWGVWLIIHIATQITRLIPSAAGAGWVDMAISGLLILAVCLSIRAHEHRHTDRCLRWSQATWLQGRITERLVMRERRQ